jgi:C4-type Zn-finger protein
MMVGVQLHSSDVHPLCPACGARMEIIRVLPRGPYVSEQLIFRCCVCEVAMTRAGDERNWR